MSTVAQPERRRLLGAMLEELVENGYPAAEVEAAARRASLDGKEWSERFPDKDTCLFTAFEQLSSELREAICEGCAAGGGWTERVAGGLRALLGALSGQAQMAEALAHSFPAIGPAARARYQEFIESLAPLLSEGRLLAADKQLPDQVELLAVGAAESIVFEEIQAGRTAGLAELGPEILFSLLAPLVGAREAAAAMEAERQLREPAETG